MLYSLDSWHVPWTFLYNIIPERNMSVLASEWSGLGRHKVSLDVWLCTRGKEKGSKAETAFMWHDVFFAFGWLLEYLEKHCPLSSTTNFGFEWCGIQWICYFLQNLNGWQMFVCPPPPSSLINMFKHISDSWYQNPYADTVAGENLCSKRL